MTSPNKTLENTFQELATINEVHPHEDQVLSYIKRRLKAANVVCRQDQIGNIVARLEGESSDTIALVAHVDIAAPLAGREIVVTDDAIKTDGTGLLGADDKAAVALMLELADHVQAVAKRPQRTIELIFTVGEEAGCIGAVALDMTLVQAKKALVLDWLGRVDNIVTKSPAYYKIDVEYIGRTAHPAEWQQGKNAGTALIAAANGLKVGEYAPGVICNIGIFEFGKARNQVPGRATLQAELRSYDADKIESAATEIEEIFRSTATSRGIEAKIEVTKDSSSYELDQSSSFFQTVTSALAGQSLKPNLQPTYGCFDGNILAARGLEVIMMGAGYYNPHSPSEYLDRHQFAEAFEFIKSLA